MATDHKARMIQNYSPLTVTAEQLEAAKAPGLFELMQSEVDAAIEQQIKWLNSPCVYIAPAPSEFTVRTPVGDIAMKADPTLEPGEVRIEVPPLCGVGSTHHSHTCERPRGHGGPHVGRGCSWGEDAVDPLDVKYDGVTLRELIEQDQAARRERPYMRGPFDYSGPGPMTPAQRAAVSAHWSAELRRKVDASAERDRNEVRIDLQDEP